MTYNNLAASTIKTLNYLFLRFTFKDGNAEKSDIIVEEFQNYLHAFPSGSLLHSDDELKELLLIELTEGEYCENLTKSEALDHYRLAISKTFSERYDLAEYFASLLDDEDYASEPVEKECEIVLDRYNNVIRADTMIVFDQSISDEPKFYLVRQIGSKLYIRKNDDDRFVDLSSMPSVFRIATAEDNPDYIEGYGCPRCFSDDTTTLLASRENTCNRCGLEFPLPEEEARGNEDEDTRYALSQLTLDAQVKAYIDELAVLAKAGVEPPSCFTSFLEQYNSDEFFYDADGNVKPPIDVS